MLSLKDQCSFLAEGKPRRRSDQVPEPFWKRDRFFTGSRQFVKLPGLKTGLDSLNDLLAMQAKGDVGTWFSTKAKGPGQFRGADSSGIMVQAMARNNRDRLKRSPTIKLNISAEPGGDGHG